MLRELTVSFGKDRISLVLDMRLALVMGHSLDSHGNDSVTVIPHLSDQGIHLLYETSLPEAICVSVFQLRKLFTEFKQLLTRSKTAQYQHQMFHCGSQDTP